MYNIIKLRIASNGTLLMHANTGVNSFDPITMEINKITGKKKKTDEDKMLLRELEWCSGIYHDDKYQMAKLILGQSPEDEFLNEGIYIPAENFEKAIKEALKLSRQGKNAEAKFSLVENKAYLNYGGPADIREMFKISRYKDDRVVSVNGKSRITRCRPRIERWETEFSIRYRPDYINVEDLLSALRIAGEIMGVGDFRPRYGKFEIEVLEEIQDEIV